MAVGVLATVTILKDMGDTWLGPTRGLRPLAVSDFYIFLLICGWGMFALRCVKLRH